MTMDFDQFTVRQVVFFLSYRFTPLRHSLIMPVNEEAASGATGLKIPRRICDSVQLYEETIGRVGNFCVFRTERRLRRYAGGVLRQFGRRTDKIRHGLPSVSAGVFFVRVGFVPVSALVWTFMLAGKKLSSEKVFLSMKKGKLCLTFNA